MNAPDDLPFTGERFIPGTPGEIWVEHWHRYHFAARLAAGKRTLDVACGEGYGSALLASRAASVVGIDVSPDAIAHAQRAYGSLAHARFERASCTALPLPDASIDLAVSFETVEHISEQSAFVAELARVLAPGGILLMSCPNKREYSDERGYRNEYHVRELYRDELAALIGERFPATTWFGQRPTFFSVIAPEGAGATAGELLEVTEAAPAQATTTLERPLYFLVAAARTPEALRDVSATLSVLSDRDDWVYRDYVKVMRMMTENHARAQALEAQVAERDARLLAPATPAWRGWRAWLREPLVRLGLLK